MTTHGRVSNGVVGSTPWGIILAGGEGLRMRAFINRQTGGYSPKQYNTFTGTRSMLRHTVDRMLRIAPDSRLVTVIGNGHRAYLSEPGNGYLPGLTIEQPENKGTACGVFLPLAHIVAQDPAAIVLVSPSDHFVTPEDRYCDYLACAATLAGRYKDCLVLIGAIPDKPETDYGWIGFEQHDGERDETAPCPAIGFYEKPDRQTAQVFLEKGWLWNTMVVACRATTLWEMARRRIPKVVALFDAYLLILKAARAGQIPPERQAVAREQVYEALPEADLSRDVLQHCIGQMIVVALKGVEWSDWGRPERVLNSIGSIGTGMSSAVPLEHAALST